MIEQMQKVTVVCLDKDRQKTVARLQELGTLHVVPTKQPSSEEVDGLVRQQEHLAELLVALTALKVQQDDCTRTPDAQRGKQAAAEGIRLMQERKADTERLAQLQQAIARLQPWGQFSAKQLDRLQAAGWNYALCAVNGKTIPEFPASCRVLPVSADSRQTRFLVLSRDELDDLDLPRVHFPLGTDLHALQQEHQQLKQRTSEQQQQLTALAKSSQADLQAFADTLAEQLDFARAEHGMGDSQNLSYIGGYVPSSKMDELRAAARQQGWGIRYLEADRDDPEVPTKLQIPRQFQIANLIFDLIGVLPGYNEVDVSVSLVIFLSIFCGFLVGDAGYGTLFLLLAAYLWRKTERGTTGRLGVILLATFSATVLVYGAMTGSWFGIPSAKLPLVFRGLPWFRDDDNGNNIKLICFFLGATHLSLARVWRAIRSSKIREALGHVGWGLFLWGNFYTVKMLIIGGDFGFVPKCLYAVAVPMIFLFAINWKDFGAVIYTPFDFINSVVDVLSYIRLYAVGLSSLYIAQNFNEMSQMIWNVSPWLIPVALLVILAGHTLNIALAVMGILVHGIRLNTLEFSNHLGLNWGGHPYKPLCKKTE